MLKYHILCDFLGILAKQVMILLIIGVTCAIMTAKYVCDCLKELGSALDFLIPTLV